MRQDIYPNPSYPSLFPIFCLPAFLLSFPLPSSLFLISLVFLVPLWTGPVRTHISSRVIDLLIDNIFFNLSLRPSPPSSGSCSYFSPRTKARTWYVCSRSICSERMSYPDALDRHSPAAVRSIGCAGYYDTPSLECALRADYTWCLRIQ